MKLEWDLSETERHDYGESMRKLAEMIDETITEPDLDKAQALRLIGSGMAMLLGLAADVVDPPKTRDDPRQRCLFDQPPSPMGGDGSYKSK